MQKLAQRGEFLLTRQRHAGDASSVLVWVTLTDDPENVRQLEHELSLADELGYAGAVRPLGLEQRDGRAALLLQDPGGEPLAKLIGSALPLRRFLELAIEITGAMRRVHGRGLIHKDLQPANILVDPAGHVHLMGFGLATRVPRESLATGSQVFVGTPAYMAPELTGRMNRSVDSRSDLYSLGLILYEMLVGHPPFEASEPLQWVHCHMTRVPPSPREYVEIPEPIAALVLKLLAKAAEERYQTARGLEIDLRRVLEDWCQHERIEPFALAQHDLPDRILIPETLRGRETALAKLTATLRRVSTEGTARVLLISGHAGVGKSAVVRELQHQLVAEVGRFAGGKFEQHQTDVPCAALLHVCRDLVRQLLTCPEAELLLWRARFLEALQAGAGLLATLIPELEAFLGVQPGDPGVPIQDFLHRLALLLGRFLRVFARPEQPLVLFLDDLQRLDRDTGQLLGLVLTDCELRNILFIGAYRDNEVDAGSALIRLRETLREAGLPIEQLVLEPLQPADLGQVIGEALHCAPEHVAELTHLVYAKTHGNPLFSVQLLTALEADGSLKREGAGNWQWDAGRVQAHGETDTVVDLLLEKLGRLSQQARGALQQLACFGTGTTVQLMSRVLGLPEPSLDQMLREAVFAGLVNRTNDKYWFAHDRVAEAAYSLIPPSDLAASHLRCGRVLLSQTRSPELADRIFEIVGHLNGGNALITSAQERKQLAELNLLAARRARQSTAYAAALGYLTSGAAFVPADSRAQCPDLTFAFEFLRAECEFLTGALDAAEQRLTALAQDSQDSRDRAAVACLRQLLYQTLGRNDRAVEVCLAYLRADGVEWTSNPSARDLTDECARLWERVGSRQPEGLLDLPLMSNPRQEALLDVLAAVLAPALMTDWNLFRLVIARMVNLSIEYGNRDGSTLAYVYLNVTLREDLGDAALGYRFGVLSVDLMEKHHLERYRARVEVAFGYTVVPWTQPLRTAIPWIRRSVQTAREGGDLTFACYNWFLLICAMLSVGEPLERVQGEAEEALAFARKLNFAYMVDVIAAQLALLHALRGLTSGLTDLNDGAFDESNYEQRLRGQPGLKTAALWYWHSKLQLHCLAGECGEALRAARNAEANLWNALSPLEPRDRHFYWALALARQHDAAPQSERAVLREALASHCGQLEALARSSPENGAARAALAAAELLRIDARTIDAEREYQTAIRAARGSGFKHEEALALELAGRFFQTRGLDTIADPLLHQAYTAYGTWGAWGKVRRLESQYPSLRQLATLNVQTGRASLSMRELDWSSVVSATRAVSGEIELERLIQTLLTLALQQVGAQRGVLVLMHRGAPRIEAEANTAHAAVEVRVEQRALSGILPESILQYVLRTQTRVLLDDATQPNTYARDEYIASHRPISVLCQPLVNQGRLLGCIYLENNLAAGAFTAARITVLEVLGIQAAISLENAYLFRDVLARETRMRRLLESNVVGIFFWGAHGRIVDANDAFLQIIDRSREELRNGTLTWYDITPPENHARDRTRGARLAAGLIRPSSHENEFVRRGGTRVPVLVGGTLLEGATDQGVAFVLDLTERIQAEQDRQARSAAEAASRAKSEFLASMSHELRTPLNGVLGYAQLLERDPALLARHRDRVRVIHSSGEHLLRLINDVLDLAKIEARRVELDPTVVPLLGFIQSIHELMRVKAHEKGVELSWQVGSEVPSAVWVDERRLRQVLLNLLANAVKFTDKGRVTLGVTSPAGGPVRFEIRDTGIGIGADQVGSLFQPFEQVGTARRRREGTGLGLAISRQLVQLMGGDIKVESRVGEGSRFWFELDVQIASPEPAIAPTGLLVSGYTGPPKAVLVVDDVLESRAVLVDLLAPLGFRVIEAANGFEALEQTRGTSFDLVLTDLSMPGMDGMELAALLRQSTEGKSVPVVIISARGSEPRVNPSTASISGFLSKPVNVDELLATIGALLSLEWTYTR